MANMTYEEKFDAVQAFCDKYDSLIKEAPEGSDLWALRELNNAFDRAAFNVVLTRRHLINAMLHIAERWSDENQDIELVCTDPATVEEVVIEGMPSEEES